MAQLSRTHALAKDPSAASSSQPPVTLDLGCFLMDTNNKHTHRGGEGGGRKA